MQVELALSAGSGQHYGRTESSTEGAEGQAARRAL